MEVLDLLELLIGGFLWTVGGFFADLILDGIFPEAEEDPIEAPKPKKRKGKTHVSVLPGLVALALLGGGTACGELVPNNVPDFDDVYYTGFHSVDDISTFLGVYVIEYREAFEKEPEIWNLEIWEDSEEDLMDRHPLLDREYIHPRLGLTISPSEIWIRPTLRLVESALAHETTHLELWRTVNDPDGGIELDENGDCFPVEANGICSHAGGDGPWTLVHNRVINRTNGY